MRTYIKFGAWLLGALLFVLLAGGLLAGYVFEDDIKGIFIHELNRQLAVPVEIEQENIQFSVLRNFPDASVSFHDIRIKESLPGSEAYFLDVDRLAFRFHMGDLMRNRYSIRRIDLAGGEIHLRRQRDGNVNYRFWKAPEDTATRLLQISLDQLSLKDLHLVWDDARENQLVDLDVRQGGASGDLSGQSFNLKLDLDLSPRHLSLDGRTLALGDKVVLEADLASGEQPEQIRLHKASLDLDGNRIGLLGSLLTGKHPSVDLRLKGEKLPTASLLEWVESLGGQHPMSGLKSPWQPQCGWQHKEEALAGARPRKSTWSSA